MVINLKTAKALGLAVRLTRRATMQWTLAYPEPPPPAQKTLGGELDAKARVEALSILARVIAQSFKSTKQMDPTDE